MRNSLGPAFVVAICLVIGVGEHHADARPRPTRSTSNFQANKTFGLGLELGTPFGLTGKYFTTPSTALDFGIGAWGYVGFRDCGDCGGGLNVYADYLWHPVSLVSAEAFELPLYFGLGARIVDYGHNFTNALGLRVPGGISFDFNNVPIDIFAQLVYTLDLVHFNGDGYFYSDLELSIGVRYYFN